MAFLDFTYKHLQVIRNTVGTLVLIVIFYILQYIFNMHFLCSCKPGLHPNGVLYMVLPPLILAFIVIIVEPFHQRKIFYRCHSFSRCTSCFSGYILKLFFKWIGLAAVWIAAVLFDGDWYVCLKTNFNKNQTGIPCKKNLTYEEQRIIGDYMTQSLEYGMVLICIFLFVWSTFEIRRLSCRLCCHQSSDDNLTYHSCCSKSLILRPYYSVIFEELLAEEVSNCLNDNLKKIAIQKANAICKPFLQAIEHHETQGNNWDKDNNGDISPSYAWETISVPAFYFGEDVSQALPDDTSEICLRVV